MYDELKEIKKLAINRYLSAKDEDKYDQIDFEDGEFRYLYGQEKVPFHVIVERKLNQIIERVNDLIRERNENLPEEDFNDEEG